MAVLTYFNWTTPTLIEFGYLLVIGIATQIGQTFMTKALQAESAAKISAMKYVGIIYALSYGVFIFNEKYSSQTLIGIGFVIIGVILNVWYKTGKTETA